ncbi:MAG: DUF2752 domain-containing protein [Acidobacteriota bacterium]
MWAASGLAALFGLVLFHYLDFAAEANGSLCFSRRFLHLSCPGCGLTRAFGALADFRLKAAFDYHPLGPVFLFEAIVLWIGWGLMLGRLVPAPSSRLVNRWLFLQLFLLLGVYAVRLATGTLPG